MMRLRWLALCFAFVGAVGQAAAGAENEQVAVQWRFDQPGQMLGWVANGHVAGAAVRDGALQGRAVGTDPILHGPLFEVPASADQVIEIEMTTSEGGMAQLFWTHTSEGRFGGFDGQRCINFTCRGDAQRRVYRLFPFWQPMKKIIRLRLDPPNEGEFAVHAIRIVAQPSEPVAATADWRFADGPGGWRAGQDVSQPAIDRGDLCATAQGSSPLLMSPPLAVTAAENSVVSICMSADKGTMGRVVCASNERFGMSEAEFPIRADGQMHWYDVEMVNVPHWRGTIVRLGLQPSNQSGANVRVRSIRVSDQATSPAELAVTWLGQTEGVNRVGRAAGVVCAVRNVGGVPATQVTATLHPGPGAKIVGPATQVVERIRREVPATLHWQIEADKPGDAEVSVTLSAEGVGPVTARGHVTFTPMPKVTPTGYVPEPQPVKPSCDVGVFYFPGWATRTRWQPIESFPNRKPVLGWYDEANPEVVDWQIKWATEHGVTFFMVDWYWSKGHRHLEHWVHDGFMKARWRKYLKWCVMWANHNAPGTHSAEDWRAVTQYWIDHYFAMPEYYRIDGRPAVFIWAPANIRRDVGGTAEAAKLYAMSQQMAREAGYEGITFVAMSSHESEAAADELKSEGYRATTSYHGFQLAMQRAEDGRRFPYADVVSTSPELWQQEDKRSGDLLYIPLVDTGWASEPWHGRRARVIYDRTPELFGQLCRKAREYVRQHDKPIVAIGPWNEWGEGSYIEPYAQYGFADLDQMRDAFCPAGDWPANLVPTDLGLGPYDLPPIEPKTAWGFDTDGQWDGWSPNGHLEAKVEGGAIVGLTTGHDPVLQGPRMTVDADEFRTVVIRMKSDRDDSAQLFWATSLHPVSETSSLRFNVQGDGQYHDYRVNVSEGRAWRGLITSLRFDPANREGTRLSVDSIRLE